jgi:hypothetical protein
VIIVTYRKYLLPVLFLALLLVGCSHPMKTVEVVSFGHPVIESSSFLAILETYDSYMIPGVGCFDCVSGNLLSMRFVRIFSDGRIETISDIPIKDNPQYTAINENTLLSTRFVHNTVGDRVADTLRQNVSLYDVDNAREINLFSNVGYAEVTRDKKFIVIRNPSRDVKESDLYELKGFQPQRVGYCYDGSNYSLLSEEDNIKKDLTLGYYLLECNAILRNNISGHSDTIYYDSTMYFHSAETTFDTNYLLVKAYTKQEVDSLLLRMDSMDTFYSNSTLEELPQVRTFEKILDHTDIVTGYYAKWRLLNIKTRKMLDIDLHAYWPFMSRDEKSVFFVVYDNGADKVYDEKWRVVLLEEMINDDKN